MKNDALMITHTNTQKKVMEFEIEKDSKDELRGKECLQKWPLYLPAILFASVCKFSLINYCKCTSAPTLLPINNAQVQKNESQFLEFPTMSTSSQHMDFLKTLYGQ